MINIIERESPHQFVSFSSFTNNGQKFHEITKSNTSGLVPVKIPIELVNKNRKKSLDYPTGNI